MTLDEMARFVVAAQNSGASGSEVVQVLVNFRRAAKTLAIEFVDQTSGVRRGL